MNIEIIEAEMKAKNAIYIAQRKREMLDIGAKIVSKALSESLINPWAGLFAKDIKVPTKNKKEI